MNVYVFIYTSILTFIISLILAIYVYKRNPRNPINRHYALVNILIGIWCSLTFLANTAKTDSDALIRVRFVYLAAIYTGPAFYHFVTTFLDISSNLSEKRKVRILYIISTLFLPFSFSKYFIKGVTRLSPFAAPLPGPLYTLFTIFFAIICIYGFYLLFSYYKNSKLGSKNQLKYLFIGFLIAFIGGVMHFLAAYIKMEPFSHDFLIIAYLAIIAYAIVKHGLMDINIVIRKTLIYSIIIAFLFIISVIILYTLTQIFGRLLPQKTFWLTLFLVTILALLFQPLYRWSTSLIDKLFFKGTLPKIAEELQRSEKLAALGVLASGLAHEIKNPLAPIKTYIQNLPSHLPETVKNDEFIKKITVVIPKEVDKITDLINQLRDFAKPPPLNLIEVDLHSLLDNKLSFLEEEFSKRNIILEKHYNSTPIKINADPIQLERVFMNIFLNALDAMPKGGKLNAATEICSDNMVLIKVSDTGTGIAKEDLPHIFDPFFSKGKHRGSGLGLAISHQIIKEHGGLINVESTSKEGTIFLVFLPTIL